MHALSTNFCLVCLSNSSEWFLWQEFARSIELRHRDRVGTGTGSRYWWWNCWSLRSDPKLLNLVRVFGTYKSYSLRETLQEEFHISHTFVSDRMVVHLGRRFLGDFVFYTFSIIIISFILFASHIVCKNKTIWIDLST